MVRAVKDRLRVPDKLAVELLKEAARSTLMKFVTASRVHANKLDQAKELKKMVFFSNVVLAPLLDAAKGPEWEKRDREAAEKEARANAELEKIVREMQQENARRQRRAREEGKTLEEIDKEEEEEERRKADEMAAREEAGTKGEAAEGSETEGRAEAAEATDAEVVAEAATEAEDQPKSLQKAEVRECSRAAPCLLCLVALDVLEAMPALWHVRFPCNVSPRVPLFSQKAKEARAGGESVDGVTRGAQKEITLQEDLDERDRKDIYRNFLIYCMTGDVVRGPMGVVMTVERDEADFARLSQLGDLLGLDRMQAAEIHKDLAEQAFKAQASAPRAGPWRADWATQCNLTRGRHAVHLPRHSSCGDLRGPFAREGELPHSPSFSNGAQQPPPRASRAPVPAPAGGGHRGRGRPEPGPPREDRAAAGRAGPGRGSGGQGHQGGAEQARGQHARDVPQDGGADAGQGPRGGQRRRGRVGLHGGGLPPQPVPGGGGATADQRRGGVRGRARAQGPPGVAQGAGRQDGQDRRRGRPRAPAADAGAGRVGPPPAQLGRGRALPQQPHLVRAR